MVKKSVKMWGVFDREKEIRYVNKLKGDAIYDSGGIWKVRPVTVTWEEVVATPSQPRKGNFKKP
jgi:hypothetical protein